MTKENYSNVSVRLNEKDYQRLQELNELHNKHSFGKVTIADTLRVCIKQQHENTFKAAAAKE